MRPAIQGSRDPDRGARRGIGNHCQDAEVLRGAGAAASRRAHPGWLPRLHPRRRRPHRLHPPRPGCRAHPCPGPPDPRHPRRRTSALRTRAGPARLSAGRPREADRAARRTARDHHSTPRPGNDGRAGHLRPRPSLPLPVAVWAFPGPAAGTAIRHVHRICGVEDPVASEAVRQVRRGLMRTYGAAPRRPARPLTVDEIRTIIGSIDRTTPIGIRDAAIIPHGPGGTRGPVCQRALRATRARRRRRHRSRLRRTGIDTDALIGANIAA